MAAERRVWCSCTIIDYLKGVERARPCIEIITHMHEGSQEIVTSVIAEAEVGMEVAPLDLFPAGLVE